MKCCMTAFERKQLIVKVPFIDAEIADITMADWPAILPPGFVEEIEAERWTVKLAIMLIEKGREFEDMLSHAHFMLAGAVARLEWLSTRHSRRNASLGLSHPNGGRMSEEKDSAGESVNADPAKTIAVFPLQERIEAQRTQISRAMSIIEACRLGSDSMLATMQGDDEPDFEGALAAAHELLSDVANELEAIAASHDENPVTP